MKETVSEFYKILGKKTRIVWSFSEPRAHLAAMIETLPTLCQKVIAIGTLAMEHDHKGEGQEPGQKETYAVSKTFILYEWMPRVKFLLLLLRDIIFQYQKALILLLDKEISPSDLQILSSKSKESIDEAVAYLQSFYETRINEILSSEKTMKSYLSKQSHRDNPWQVYLEQIKTIEEQSESLHEQFQAMSKTVEDLQSINEEVSKTMSSIEQELGRVRNVGIEARDMLDDVSTASYHKILKQIDLLEDQSLAFNYYNSYQYVTDQIIAQMCEVTKVPVALVISKIQYKEVDFANSAKMWLQGAIRPNVAEAQEILDSIGNSMKMALVNVKNRATILLNKKEEISQDLLASAGFDQALDLVIETIDQKKDEIEYYQSEVIKRLNDKLRISSVYMEDRNFLDSSQQYVISQLKLDQSAWILRIKSWIQIRTGIARGFMANVAQEESLSVSEKIVRHVESHKTPSDNQQYTNIFSTQGYIGESFWVGRQKELSHVRQLINNWKSGYRGSVIVSGKRFSGKTVFGELIAHRHFFNTAIRLKPYTVLKVDGRSLKVEDDISEAIDFIKKHSVNKRYFIWIDDLESWQSIRVPPSKNVQALLKHIDSLSTQLFFMVSMNNWYKHHFNKMFHVQKVFQAEINLDYMSEEEIKRATMIRHGATHKMLVNEEGIKVTSQEFSNMVHKINRVANNNIGQVLNLWSYFTKRYDDEKVIHTPVLEYDLPDFLNDENAILLRTVLMNRRTNEYQLRKILGVAFRDKYHAIVLRLINLGILTRHMDGLLEINEGIVNDVAALLDEAGYIKYKK